MAVSWDEMRLLGSANSFGPRKAKKYYGNHRDDWVPYYDLAGDPKNNEPVVQLALEAVWSVTKLWEPPVELEPGCNIASLSRSLDGAIPLVIIDAYLLGSSGHRKILSRFLAARKGCAVVVPRNRHDRTNAGIIDKGRTPGFPHSVSSWVTANGGDTPHILEGHYSLTQLIESVAKAPGSSIDPLGSGPNA
jgi:hypothetical protein